MSEVTVKALASEIDTSVERLLKQFEDAGITKAADDNVSQDEKQTLLSHLKREHGESVPDGLKAALLMEMLPSLSHRCFLIYFSFSWVDFFLQL